MASLLQVCLALLLVSCVHGQGPVFQNQLSSQCESRTIHGALSNCNLALHNALGIASSADATAISNAICNNIPAVITYNRCLRSNYETCLSSDDLRLLQTDADARDWHQYYCDHRNEINQNCILTALKLDACTINVSFLYNSAISESGLVRAACSYLEALRGCIFNLGPSCPNHNKDVYDTYWAKSYPPACAGGARSVPTSFLLLGACAVLFNKMAAVLLF